MKRFLPIFLMLCLLCGCAQNVPPDAQGIAVTDSLGSTCYLSADAKVVSCYGSYAEMWLLAGGQLSGVTEDATSEHDLDVGDAVIVGSVKHINLEKLVALEPDYVILSADLTAHLSLKESLEAMGIPCGYFRVDTFDDYKAVMQQFCCVTGREDLYQTNVLDVEAEIAAVKAKIPETDSTALLLRVFSTGMKAKGSDNLAGQILEEFGLVNIAGEQMLEELSLEHIVQTDPDYIFALTMGSEAGAQAYFQEHIQSNPAWSGLSAVQNGNYQILPKELFHYKPNNRWSESYEYLARLIWPDLF